MPPSSYDDLVTYYVLHASDAAWFDDWWGRLPNPTQDEEEARSDAAERRYRLLTKAIRDDLVSHAVASVSHRITTSVMTPTFGYTSPPDDLGDAATDYVELLCRGRVLFHSPASIVSTTSPKELSATLKALRSILRCDISDHYRLETFATKCLLEGVGASALVIAWDDQDA